MFAVLACFVVPAYGQGNAHLRLVQTIPMPGVEGRIDHLSADVKGQRVFVAALGNNSLEVIDIAQKKTSAEHPWSEGTPRGRVYC